MDASTNSALHFIFLYGKGGAGKDTEGDRLALELPEAATISTGDEIKRAQNPDHRFHELVSPYLHYIPQGLLFPLEVTINLENPERSIFPALVSEKLAEGRQTIISTGFPRTSEQLHALDEYLDRFRSYYFIVEHHIWLDVSDETVRERIAKRRAEYEAKGLPIRNDDTPGSVEKRLKTFQNEIIPLINELWGQGRLIRINAEGTIDEVHELVKTELGLRPALELYTEGQGQSPERI